MNGSKAGDVNPYFACMAALGLLAETKNCPMTETEQKAVGISVAVPVAKDPNKITPFFTPSPLEIFPKLTNHDNPRRIYSS